MPRETILLPVVFPDPDCYPLSDSFVRELAGFEVSLLGYWAVTEWDAVADAREAHETEARAVLHELASQFGHAGVPTDVQLHFGPGGDDDALWDRVAEESHASGILLPNTPTLLRRVLVAVRDAADADRLVDLVAGLNPDTTLELELYHAADGSGAEDAAAFLDEMRATLRDRGFADVEVATTVEPVDDAEAAVVRRADDHELVVLGRTVHGDRDASVFGPTYERIAAETDLPILVPL